MRARWRVAKFTFEFYLLILLPPWQKSSKNSKSKEQYSLKYTSLNYRKLKIYYLEICKIRVWEYLSHLIITVEQGTGSVWRPCPPRGSYSSVTHCAAGPSTSCKLKDSKETNYFFLAILAFRKTVSQILFLYNTYFRLIKQQPKEISKLLVKIL